MNYKITIDMNVLEIDESVKKYLVWAGANYYLFCITANPTAKLQNLLNMFIKDNNCIEKKVDCLLGFLDCYNNNILHSILMHKNYNLFFELINYIKLEDLMRVNTTGQTVLHYLNNINCCELIMILSKKFPECNELKQLSVMNNNCNKFSRQMDNLDYTDNTMNKKTRY